MNSPAKILVVDDTARNVKLLADLLAVKGYSVVTAGSGRPPADYWALVERLGLQNRVRHILRPETDDLIKLYQHATAFALSSDEEGLGVVILEAMACGLPVITSTKSGAAELLTEGLNGFVCDARDIRKITQAMQHLHDKSQANTMGLAARSVAEGYDWRIIGDSLTHLYQSLSK